MKKLIRLFMYGGLDKEQFRWLKHEFDETNHKILIFFAAVSFVFAASIFLLSSAGLMSTSGYIIYLYAAIGYAIILLLNILIKKNRALLLVSMFCFLCIVAGAAIAKSVTGISLHNRATVYLVFIMFLSFPFHLSPVSTITLTVILEAVYLLVIRRFQSGEAVYSTNVTNSFIFSFMGILLGLFMTSLKIKGLYNEKLNKHLMEYDIITGMLNRRSFEKDVHNDNTPSIVAVYYFDVNELKAVNDTIGHNAGDEIICGAAQCIKKVFDEFGKTYRIGGDEYAALLESGEDELEELNRTFCATVEEWSGEIVKTISVSFGYATRKEFPDLSITELVRIADQKMLNDKHQYHTTKGTECI